MRIILEIIFEDNNFSNPGWRILGARWEEPYVKNLYVWSTIFSPRFFSSFFVLSPIRLLLLIARPVYAFDRWTWFRTNPHNNKPTKMAAGRLAQQCRQHNLTGARSRCQLRSVRSRSVCVCGHVRSERSKLDRFKSVSVWAFRRPIRSKLIRSKSVRYR